MVDRASGGGAAGRGTGFAPPHHLGTIPWRRPRSLHQARGTSGGHNNFLVLTDGQAAASAVSKPFGDVVMSDPSYGTSANWQM